jgi:hypothetical protein
MAEPQLNTDPNREVTLAEAMTVRESIRSEKHVGFTVVSGSMEPVIMTGSLIEVEPVESIDELRTFDIILFWNGKRLICHYLWHLNQLPGADGSRIIITRPLTPKDGEDLPVAVEHVLGRIASHKIPFWRRVRIIFRKRFKEARRGVLSQ